jgi:hypothetical protein
MIADDFHNILLPFGGENLSSCLLLGNFLLILKLLLVTLFTKLVLAFRKPPVTPKVVLKAACDSEKCSESRLWRVLYMRKSTAKDSRNGNFYAAFGTTFRISKCSQRSMQKLFNCFFFTRQPKNLKTISTYKGSYNLIE